MSEDEWNGLRMGSVVVERRSGTPRVILGTTRRDVKQGPRKGQVRHIITMRKLVMPSRRHPCELTVLFPSDWAPRLDLAYGKHIRVTQGMQWCERHGLSHFTWERDGRFATDMFSHPLRQLARRYWTAPGLTRGEMK